MRRINNFETDPTMTLEPNGLLAGPWVPVLKTLRRSDLSARRLPQVLVALAITLFSWSSQVAAADLKPETLQAWEAYLHAAKARNQKHLADGASLLSIDTEPHSAKLHQGDVIVLPARPNVPIKVASGLIHDWTGAIFIPDASIGDVLRAPAERGPRALLR